MFELIAQNLRYERERAGLSIEQLARRARLSRALVESVEHMQAGDPWFRDLEALADALGVEVVEFFKRR